jgi:hypothetical protein
MNQTKRCCGNLQAAIFGQETGPFALCMFTNTPDEHFIIDLELGPRAPLMNAPRALTNSSSWSSLARADAFGKLASEAGPLGTCASICKVSLRRSTYRLEPIRNKACSIFPF